MYQLQFNLPVKCFVIQNLSVTVGGIHFKKSLVGKTYPTLKVAPQHRVYFFVDRIFWGLGHPSSLVKVTIRFFCVKKASEDGKYQKDVKIDFWKKKIQHTKVLSKCCISDLGGVRREEGPIQKYSLHFNHMSYEPTKISRTS